MTIVRSRCFQRRRANGSDVGGLAVLALLLIPWTSGAKAQQSTKKPATLIIVNGRIWTGTPAAQDGHEPTALGIRGETIEWVGDDAHVRRFANADTKVIDAAGRRIIPGITDSHIHLIGGGFQLGRLSLRSAQNRTEFVRAVGDAAKDIAQGRWLLGGRWSVDSWKDARSPTRQWLDPVTGDMPAFLTRMDGHQALANTAALRLAGIDANGPADPFGGEIVRDAVTREPTGILKESAMDLVSGLIPPPKEHDRQAALRRAMQHANAHGITSVHDMSQPEDIPIFRRAMREKALTLRVTSYVQTENWERCYTGYDRDRTANDWFRVVGVKGYMDGSLGSRTAYMREPYTDADKDMRYPRGQLTAFAANRDKFRSRLAEAEAHGLQTAIHAIGDQANHLLLNAYESVSTEIRPNRRWPRVEHAQHLLVEDIPRFKQLGVVASMQPFHKADDGRYAEKAIGKERLRGSYAFRGLVDAGALVCFGSDWPVVTLDPFAGMDSAVNARTLAGEVWLPSHSLTVEEALRAYTVSPHRAIGNAERVGAIVVGQLADVVILDKDLLTIDAKRIGDVHAAMTIVGGRVVYEREP